MYLCPYDANWCTRPGCRCGICELTGERPSVACINCGGLLAGSLRVRLCAECVLVETVEEEES
jgi:hypothetical protein